MIGWMGSGGEAASTRTGQGCPPPVFANSSGSLSGPPPRSRGPSDCNGTDGTATEQRGKAAATPRKAPYFLHFFTLGTMEQMEQVFSRVISGRYRREGGTPIPPCTHRG